MPKALKLSLISAITLIRVPAAVVSCWHLLHQDFPAAWLWFMISVSTDVIDGQLARHWRLVTKFGAKADLYSDVAIYYLFIPSVYWYSQRFSYWWQMNLPPVIMVYILIALAAVVILWLLIFGSGQSFGRWYKAKGNFWFGISQVAAVGLWLAVKTSWLAVIVIVSYGLCASYISRDKLASKL